MATRFYFPASGYIFPPNINRNTSPAYSGGWTQTPNPAPGRSGSAFFKPNGASGNYNQQRTTIVSPYYEMLQQYTSEPIPAFSFTGSHTWSGQFLCTHQNAPVANVMGGACIIKAVSNDGNTLRGTLLTWLPTTLGAPPSATQSAIWATTDTNRQLPANSLASASVVCYNGDRLVFEIGYMLLDLGATHQGRILFNASGTTDLTLGDQSQTDTTLCGFIETSADIFTLGRTCRTRTTT